MEIRHFKDDDKNRDVISLCSGAMGLDIGLAKAGLNIAVGQDFDPVCVATMRANRHNVLGGNIQEIDPVTLLDYEPTWNTYSNHTTRQAINE